MTYPPLPEIDRIDRRTFEEEVRPAAQPVVLRGLGRDWPAVVAAHASAEEGVGYLKRFSHPQPVSAILGEPSIEGRFFYTPDLKSLNFVRGQTPLDPFLDRLLRDRDHAQPYAMAIQSVPLPQLLPGFADSNESGLLPPAVVPRMWLGNAIRVATHYDLMENIGVVVMGRRRFTLFPPDQIANLYMGPLELTPAGTPISLVDPDAPDLDRYPRFAEAAKVGRSATLEPGDAIYIPFHWWHAVVSLDPINAFVNYWWNPARTGMGNPYDALLHALVAIGSLPQDQRGVYRDVFEHLVFRMNGEPAAHLPDDVKGVLGTADATTAARMRATLLDSFSRG
ncbi:cupin-like domain-containing protein [Microvirga sp. SRT01]|uniref:Cupin-like domain-containing protein n=1 Tax=Sphingomonas longa TaxID=2778730 RepID=A0ABS2D4Z7_9SPHN|nr:cupin-like domain-containing protein [Microvirga sp. SRT01]MBM6575992.1 cupin-like domain-containing protein [Sphingomonas sp. BT552]MBR7709038.1 cupin-like domain-containing protein [Microvirga sp. SRT01]